MPISDRIIPSSQMLITHDMPWCKTTINQPSPDAGQVIKYSYFWRYTATSLFTASLLCVIGTSAATGCITALVLVMRSKNLGGSQSQIMVYIFIPIEQVTKIMQGKEAKIQYNKK